MNLAVLHPCSLSVFLLSAKVGFVSHGFQYELVLKYDHQLQRSAYNFCCGSFGKVRDRDRICVQSLDGTLSFFDQNKFLFSCVLPGARLPGPVTYLPMTDSLLTVLSNHQLECYQFQVILASSETKSRTEPQSTEKRVSHDWTFNLSEAALQINLVTSAKRTEIAVLGERNIFIVSHDGKLRTVLKLEYSPTCFTPFATTTDGSGVSFIVGTNTKTLMIHENTRLAWSARLPHIPLQIKVANFRSFKGSIVTIGDDGVLLCTYLGTTLGDSLGLPSLRTVKNKACLKWELNELTKEISQLETSQDYSFLNVSEKEEIEISVEVPSALDCPSKSCPSEVDNSERIPSVTVTVRLKVKADVGALRNVSVRIIVPPPLTVDQSARSIPFLDENGFSFACTCFMKYSMLPMSLDFSYVATYFNVLGNPRVVTSSVMLPLALVARPCKPSNSATCKVTIEMNKPAVSLEKLFSGLIGDDGVHQEHVLGFKFFGLQPVVTLLMDKSQHSYHLQSLDCSYIWHIANKLCMRLMKFYEVSGSTSQPLVLSCKGLLPINDYFEVVDRHFECCQKRKALERELENYAIQFRKVQVKLLTLMKDFTSARVNNLEVLLEATYMDMQAAADNLDRNTLMLTKLSAHLSCATQLFLLTLKSLKDFQPRDWHQIAAAFSFSVYPHDSQGWEEKTLLNVELVNERILSKKGNAMLSRKPCNLHFTMDALRKTITNLCNLASSDTTDLEKSAYSLRNCKQGETSSVEEKVVVTGDFNPVATPAKVKEPVKKSKQCNKLSGNTREDEDFPTVTTKDFPKLHKKRKAEDERIENSLIVTASDADLSDEQLVTVCIQLHDIKPPEKPCNKKTSAGVKPSVQQVPDLDLLITEQPKK